MSNTQARSEELNGMFGRGKCIVAHLVVVKSLARGKYFKCLDTLANSLLMPASIQAIARSSGMYSQHDG